MEQFKNMLKILCYLNSRLEEDGSLETAFNYCPIKQNLSSQQFNNQMPRIKRWKLAKPNKVEINKQVNVDTEGIINFKQPSITIEYVFIPKEHGIIFGEFCLH